MSIKSENLVVKSISGIFHSRVGISWLHNKNLTPIALSILASLIFALLVLVLGPISLPIIFSVLILFPWLLKDVFRLFILLIGTWPVLSIYLRIPLPAGIPDISYDRVLVLLLLCVIIIESLISKRQLKKVTPFDFLVITYVIAQLISRIFVLWFGGIGKADVNGLLDIIFIPAIMYWIVKNLFKSSFHLKWFLYALITVSVFICASGLYDRAIGADRGWLDVPGGRAVGVLGNPAIFGATLGMGILACIVCMVDAKRVRTRMIFIAVIGVLIYGVFVSYTRSAWVSVFIVLFIAQFFISGLWKKTMPFFFIGLLILILMWDKFPTGSAYLQRAMTVNTITDRVTLARVGWERFLERPFLGWGSGALNIFSHNQTELSSHNIYLTFLVDGGVFLFLSFLVVIGYLLIRAIRTFMITKQGSFERNILVAMVGNILIFLLSGLALELRFFGYFNVLFWMSAGIIDFLGSRLLGGKSISEETKE